MGDEKDATESVEKASVKSLVASIESLHDEITEVVVTLASKSISRSSSITTIPDSLYTSRSSEVDLPMSMISKSRQSLISIPKSMISNTTKASNLVIPDSASSSQHEEEEAHLEIT